MAYNDGGFKVTIKSKTSKEEILNHLAMALTYLETTHGIEEFSNINIYLQMYKDDERQVLIDPNNPSKQSGGFVLKPETEHKTFEVLSDGSKKVIYKKDVDFKRIQETIDNLIKLPALSKYKSVAVKKVDEAREQHELLLKEQREKEQEAYEKKLAERKIAEQKEEKVFRVTYKDELNRSVLYSEVYDLQKKLLKKN